MTNQTIKLSKVEFPSEVKELLRFLSSHDIYLIGGFVRDLVLEAHSFDLDFVLVNKTTAELGKDILKKFSGHYFLLDAETKTTRFVLENEDCKNYTFDFTQAEKNNLEKDFLRRDFTINALAIDLKNPDLIIDHFGGINDLKQKKIKTIKFENMADDPLRFLRAFRFASLLNGDIDKDLIDFIHKNPNLFNETIAVERIANELWKMLDTDNSYKYMIMLSESGLLEKIIPELAPMRKVTPNSHHHLWLYDHSLELIKTFEENFYKIPDWAKEELNKPCGNAQSPIKKAVTKLSCLLHDVGKPGTWEIKNVNGEEKHTFYGHDKTGADITKNICERLKFSNAVTDMLSKLVRYHLRPFQLSQNNAPITERALYRFFRDVKEDIPLLLMLAMADLYATRGPKITDEDIKDGEKLLLYLFDEYKKYETRETEKAKKPKLLDGNEIMKLTGLQPSPRLGNLIDELNEAIAVGEVKTKEEAIEWVKKATIEIH